MCYFPRSLELPASRPVAAASIEWEETNCLLCQGKHWQTLVEAPDTQGHTGLWFAVVQCQDCGLCFTNPRPAAHCLEPFYPSDYRPHQLVEASSRLGSWHRRRPPIPWHGQGRLLDFGCGGGSFLQQMREHGWQVTGLDNAVPTVNRVRDETGLNVLPGTLPHPELEPQSFDVITMWHSLEHVPNPREVVQAAWQLLAPGGMLMVSTPNIDSLAFRIFGPCWFGLDLPRHLTHFAPWTLHFFLERAGFRVHKIRMVRRSAWLRHSAEIACRHPQHKWLHRRLRGKLLSRLAAFYSCLTNQSDSMMVTAYRDRDV